MNVRMNYLHRLLFEDTGDLTAVTCFEGSM